VGQEILLSVNVEGAGYDAAAYRPVFINLSQVGGNDGGTGQPLPANVETTALNDWYSDATGTGGFTVTFSYELTAADVSVANDAPWLLALGYTGSGAITDAWVNSYAGEVNVSVVSTTQVEYSNVGIGFIPVLEVGDVISVSVEVDGAPYSDNDFTFAFSQ